MSTLDHPFLLGWSLEDCIFWGIGSFHLDYQIGGHIVIYGLPLLFSYNEICSDVPSYNSNISYLCHLSFS